MNKIKKLFGNTSMKWLNVILFAVISGIYTGLIMLVPFLTNTSFQDIGICYEWWVFFAVIVVVNCEKNWDAMLKCFVFFVISQPVVYFVQVAFGALSWDMALYYLRIWTLKIILTLPGGLVAFYCKKQNVLGAVILGLGNTILALEGISHLGSAIKDFPYHLLSGLISIAFIVILTFAIQEKTKNRIIAIVVPVVLSAGVTVYCCINGLTLI